MDVDLEGPRRAPLEDACRFGGTVTRVKKPKSRSVYWGVRREMETLLANRKGTRCGLFSDVIRVLRVEKDVVSGHGRWEPEDAEGETVDDDGLGFLRAPTAEGEGSSMSFSFAGDGR